MAHDNLAIDLEPDVQLAANADTLQFDNLLADDVIMDWLMQLEREQNAHAAAVG